MTKRILIGLALAAGSFVAAVPQADAVIFYGGPVRRAAARTVLPPYPAARRVVARPVVGYPVYRAPVLYGSPAWYGSPVVYGPGVSIGIGF